jgi:hypothetical protein
MGRGQGGVGASGGTHIETLGSPGPLPVLSEREFSRRGAARVGGPNRWVFRPCQLLPTAHGSLSRCTVMISANNARLALRCVQNKHLQSI